MSHRKSVVEFCPQVIFIVQQTEADSRLGTELCNSQILVPDGGDRRSKILRTNENLELRKFVTWKNFAKILQPEVYFSRIFYDVRDRPTKNGHCWTAKKRF